MLDGASATTRLPRNGNSNSGGLHLCWLDLLYSPCDQPGEFLVEQGYPLIQLDVRVSRFCATQQIGCGP